MKTINNVTCFSDAGQCADEVACLHLYDIIQDKALSAVFQPILNTTKGCFTGYEGLIRGPINSILHSPMALFDTARSCGLVAELEYLCRQTVLESFAALKLPGKIFLNVSPDILLQKYSKSGETLKYVDALGLKPSQVIIELTENAKTLDYQLMRDATHYYREMGFEIAIDDLGEGFSGLRLWSEIRPNYVKIDKHFTQNIHQDPVKLQFARSIQEIAEKSGAQVIAEGIETHEQLMAIRDLGITYSQGYHIAKPHPTPIIAPSSDLVQTLMRFESDRENILQNRATVEKLLKQATPVTPTCPNETVFKMFDENPELYSIPVVQYGKPIGLINRSVMINDYARPFRRELYGQRSCEIMADKSALIVDKNTSLKQLSDLILESKPHHLSAGFIVTENGEYAGMASGHDLLRLITKMQIDTARYANPLTLLPGNVPISEHIDSLLQSGAQFVACYCDLDYFKPYNDVYGYKKGDEVIQKIGQMLTDACGQYDFVGHIGGDDFIILFQSHNWESRCRTLLSSIQTIAPSFYSEADRKHGGIVTKDRQGDQRFHPFTSLSIGALMVNSSQYLSHHEVATACVSAKKQAKEIAGNSLFIERRNPQEAIEEIAA